MYIQVGAGFLGLVGLFSGIFPLFLVCGIICLIIDIMGLFSGNLKPFMPIVLFIIGYIIIGSWHGIFLGALAGSLLDGVGTLVIARKF